MTVRYGEPEAAVQPWPGRTATAVGVLLVLLLVGQLATVRVRTGGTAAAAGAPTLELTGATRSSAVPRSRVVTLAFEVRNVGRRAVTVLSAGGPVGGLTPVPLAASGAAASAPDGTPTVVPGPVVIAAGAVAELAVSYTVTDCAQLRPDPAPLYVSGQVGDGVPALVRLPAPTLPGQPGPWYLVLGAQVCAAAR